MRAAADLPAPAERPDPLPGANCHERSGLAPTSTSPVVALAGPPNSGKSTLFNALTGAGRAVANYPGTTVEIGRGRWVVPEIGELALADLPGTYSLNPQSPDEELTTGLLRGADLVDLVVLVCDAAHLGRSLVLAAGVRELPVRVVVALTMNDVAADRGVTVDAAKLSKRLGVPVVKVDPRRRRETGALSAAVVAAFDESVPAPLGLVPATNAGSSPSGCCPNCPPGCTCGMDAGAPDQEHLELADAEALFTWIAETSEMATTRTDEVRRNRSDLVDRWVTAPVLGPLIFLAVMWAVFQATTRLAAPLQDALDAFFSGPVSAAVKALMSALRLSGGLIESFLLNGIVAGVGMLLTFVPLMTIMFVLLALLEDSGYMARAAVVTDRLMGALGLPGRAFLPLVVGFGCNVPAISAVKVLPDARHRLLTALLVPFTSCTARLTVYLMVADTFFPGNAGTVVFAMYVVSILLVVLFGLLLRGTLFRTMGNDPLVLDLPPYQRPHPRVLGAITWTRVRGFLETAGGIIVATVTVVWLLGVIPAPGSGGHFGAVDIADSLYAWLAGLVSVLFSPAGFGEWHAVGALVVGFVAKEAVISSWAQTNAAADGDLTGLSHSVLADFTAASGGHPQAAALAFLIFILAYTPCVATLAVQKRQIGLRWTLGGVAMQFALAWLLAVAVFQTIVAFS
ncbi:MAG: ferrous iron transport protein B [Candidatus Nanopelagicales bacterium]